MNRIPMVSVLGALAVLVAGCSSPQFSRIDQNRAVYESWPLDIQQLVLDGKVEPGMTPEMVRVSWGEPTRIETPPSGEEIWIYEKGGSDGTMVSPGVVGPSQPSAGLVLGGGGNPAMGGSPSGYPYPAGYPPGGGIGGMGGQPIYMPPTPPEVREVIFRDGVVHKADKP